MVFKIQVSLFAEIFFATLSQHVFSCPRSKLTFILSNWNPQRYDIPVLHVNDIYWAKHRLSAEEAIAGIEEACKGSFEMRQGEPDASRLEHN